MCDEPNLQLNSSTLLAATSSDPQPESSAAQRNHQASGRLHESAEDLQLIHGLSVERYRAIYNSVLQPSVLTALPISKNTDYVCHVLELKQQLWMQLSRPRLQETVREDGRVEVTEILDLT